MKGFGLKKGPIVQTKHYKKVEIEGFPQYGEVKVDNIVNVYSPFSPLIILVFKFCAIL